MNRVNHFANLLVGVQAEEYMLGILCARNMKGAKVYIMSDSRADQKALEAFFPC